MGGLNSFVLANMQIFDAHAVRRANEELARAQRGCQLELEVDVTLPIRSTRPTSLTGPFDQYLFAKSLLWKRDRSPA